MNLNKLLSAALLTTAALSLGSCNDNNKDTDIIYRYDFQRCYTVVTDLNESQINSTTVSSPVTIQMFSNWTTSKADISISGMSIGGQTYPVISIENASWQLVENNTWGRVMSAPIATLPTGQYISLDRFNLEWTDRPEIVGTVVSEYTPALAFDFIIDGRYRVAGSNQPFVMGGTTESTPQGGETFKSNISLYVTTLDFSTKKAAIKINNANFAPGMPSLNMEFPGVDYEIEPDGSVKLSCASLIPTIGGTPYEDYKITDLEGEINPGRNDSEIEFTCTFTGAFADRIEALFGTNVFNVKADIDFTSYEGYLKN